jgi:hypothetical protein
MVLVKYAVGAVSDQTWIYLTPTAGTFTYTPAEAVLFDTREAAAAAMQAEKADFVEDVEDEAVFCAQPDTW